MSKMWKIEIPKILKTSPKKSIGKNRKIKVFGDIFLCFINLHITPRLCQIYKSLARLVLALARYHFWTLGFAYNLTWRSLKAGGNPWIVFRGENDFFSQSYREKSNGWNLSQIKVAFESHRVLGLQKKTWVKIRSDHRSTAHVRNFSPKSWSNFRSEPES